MLKTYYHKNNTWNDFSLATKEKFDDLADEKNINEYIRKKFLASSNRDKTVHLDDNIYLSLHFPDLKNREYVTQEIKFIIGRNYIMTNQEFNNEGLANFRKVFESSANFEKEEEYDTCVVYIFLHMIEKIYENMIFELRELESKIDDIERQIWLFANDNKLCMKITQCIEWYYTDYRYLLLG